MWPRVGHPVWDVQRAKDMSQPAAHPYLRELLKDDMGHMAKRRELHVVGARRCHMQALEQRYSVARGDISARRAISWQ